MRSPLGGLRAAVVVGAAGVALTCAGLAASATSFHNTETRWYTVALRPADVVPRAPGNASGRLRARVTVVRGKPVALIDWQLTFRGLRGDALEAHIHAGRPGAVGPVLIPLCVLCTSGMRGTARFPAALAWFRTVWSRADDDEGRSRVYVDVHTARRPSGAIRGPLASPNWMGWVTFGDKDPDPPDHYPTRSS